nr:DUF1656 domain-containing protein [uncultured Lichenicoccus sp.]
MMPLREIDIFGIFVTPAVICLVVGLVISVALRRALDLTQVNRYVWNRALFDLGLLVAITSLLILSLRFAGG